MTEAARDRIAGWVVAEFPGAFAELTCEVARPARAGAGDSVCLNVLDSRRRLVSTILVTP